MRISGPARVNSLKSGGSLFDLKVLLKTVLIILYYCQLLNFFISSLILDKFEFKMKGMHDYLRQ